MQWVLLLGFLAVCYLSSPPYFPIEISRMLESSANARISFIISIVVFALSLPAFPLVELVCAAGIVGFDDKRFWTLHMLSVGLLFGYIAFYKMPLTYFLAALSVYSFRFVLKGVTLWFCEECISFEYAMDLMLGTRDFRSKWTRVAFQAAGVCQWVAFGVVISKIK